MKTEPSASKPPKFQRPNPEGAKSKSKIVRANGVLAKLVSTIERGRLDDTAHVLLITGKSETHLLTEIKPSREGDEAKFNAAYQRHLRKLDADKIKHPKK